MITAIIIAIYLGLLIAIGFIFGRINRNTSDYFRGGQRGTWWLVGMSMLMMGVSARTFTGNAAVGYQAGLSFLIIYLVQLIALPVELYVGPRFRRLRVTTSAEVVRERYGAGTEQFVAYLRTTSQLFMSGFWLWGFGSGFGIPFRGLAFWGFRGSGLRSRCFPFRTGTWPQPDAGSVL